MSRKTMRKLFVLSIIIGLVSNFWSDYTFRQQREATIAVRQWVEHSQLLLRQLERVRGHALQYPEMGEAAVFQDFQTLTDLANGQAEQSAKIELLRKKFEISKSGNAIDRASFIKVTEEFIANEEKQLEQVTATRLQKEAELNRLARDANLIDVFLFVVCLVFFLFEIQFNRKTTKSLTETLEALRKSNIGLMELEAFQKQQIKNIVHDLKNPIGSIRSCTELMENNGKPSSDFHEMSHLIRRLSDRSLEIVDSLLRNELPAQAPLLEDRKIIDLRLLTTQILELVRPLADSKRQSISFKYESVELISANHARVFSAVSNIIDNAIKYSPFGSSITIRCYLAGAFVRLEVLDEGPGFSDSDKRKAFVAHQTLSAKPTGKETATGFGLFAAHQWIAMEGGSLNILDNPAGHGALMVLELPVQNIAPIPTPQAANAALL